ncbi:Antibiotic biosynthesis monooxygenase [Lutibacter agarilyticus]|uniref:Antibiotic biosynthesis monooxygenase n=1 Tax=Lutibacter agarilyticus TaxID=1109740 RepID=A0A238WLS1_9FLAO|nr:antibiotic biosynthesis monooxygenase [Lutibacter agarilyticus]SNR47378.1 Antibiotic biosynthesis monooxygenase [Lutibacter agarilyticus]
MYTYIVSFKVKEGEGISFVELQKFEELTEAKPAGLDHFHIFKDQNEENRFFLVEYWASKEDRLKMEASKEYQLFREHRKLVVEKKYETYECDVII